MGPFPNSFGNKYILVAVDYVSNRVEAPALPTNDASIVTKFLKRLFSQFGAPRAIISNGDTHFCNVQMEKVLKRYRVTHRISTPYHPQTNGKIERYHRSLKGEINQLPYDMPSELCEAIRAFIDYYNYQRYHEGLSDVTPHDVYTGRHVEIIQMRKEAKSRTLQARRDYNRVAREQGNNL